LLNPDLLSTFGLIGLLAVVFIETGLLVGFFLPGDSRLFTAGVLVAQAYPLPHRHDVQRSRRAGVGADRASVLPLIISYLRALQRRAQTQRIESTDHRAEYAGDVTS
jgi:hypothetical protein